MTLHEIDEYDTGEIDLEQLLRAVATVSLTGMFFVSFPSGAAPLVHRADCASIRQHMAEEFGPLTDHHGMITGLCRQFPDRDQERLWEETEVRRLPHWVSCAACTPPESDVATEPKRPSSTRAGELTSRHLGLKFTTEGGKTLGVLAGFETTAATVALTFEDGVCLRAAHGDRLVIVTARDRSRKNRQV